MPIDFNGQLVNFDGNVMLGRVEGSEEVQPVLLGSICINALHANLDEERNLSGERKLERGLLARAIFRAMKDEKPMNTKPEQIVLLKSLIGKTYPSPVIVTGAWELLDDTVAAE